MLAPSVAVWPNWGQAINTLLGLAATAVALAWLWRQLPAVKPWQACLLAAPLLFCLQPLIAYDYIWLAALLPLFAQQPAAQILLLAYAPLTILTQRVLGDAELSQRFAINSAALALILLYNFWRWQHDLTRKAGSDRGRSGV